MPELDIPYFAELARHVVAAAAGHGWTVLIDQTGGAVDQERVVADGIRDHLIDGLIFSPLALTGADLDQRADATPMVLLGERVDPGPTDHVAIDNVAAAREVTAHLAASGRRRIAAVGTQRAASGASARLRLAGYKAGARRERACASTSAWWPRPRPGTGPTARTPSGSCWSPGVRPDAVFCFNDTLALGAMRALHEHGLRVPDDVAVAGFDDIEDGRFSVPTLTTVAPDKEEIAKLAVDLLARRLTQGDGPARQLTATWRLEIRESTAPR